MRDQEEARGFVGEELARNGGVEGAGVGRSQCPPSETCLGSRRPHRCRRN
jgi:hypothetical protein